MKDVDVQAALSKASDLRAQVAILLEEAAFRAHSVMSEAQFLGLCGESWERMSRASKMPNAFPQMQQQLAE